MNDIQVFDFEDNAVRVIEKDGEPWFVAADVARVLEYRDAEVACRALDDDEKGTLIVCTPGGAQEMRGINESGLYHLVLVSRKPEAKKFRKWVTAEVLPSIRKTGMYVAPEVDVKSADEVRGRDDFANLPDRTFQQWINLVRETRLLFGRDAARRVWNQSPLPSVSGADPVGAFTPEQAKGALDLVLRTQTADGVVADLVKERREKAMKRAGVRFYVQNGVEYLSIATAFFRRACAGTIYDNGGLARALLKIDGAFVLRCSVRFGSSVVRPVAVPFPCENENVARAG